MYGLSDEVFLEFLLCRALNFQYVLHTTQEEKQPLSASEVRKASIQDTPRFGGHPRNEATSGSPFGKFYAEIPFRHPRIPGVPACL